MKTVSDLHPTANPFSKGVRLMCAWNRIRPEWILTVVLMIAGAIGRTQEHYYDLTAVSDRRENFQYVEDLKRQPGGEKIATLPHDYLLYLVERMGHIDRYHANAEIIGEHIQATVEVQTRYYSENPLSSSEVKRYLLPLRLRYESSSNLGWRAILRERMASVCFGGASATESARNIFGWIEKNIKFVDLGDSYPVPFRGDLDPVTVIRGCRGNEIDLALLAAAALRAQGIASRLVWVPVLRDRKGGKVWMEFLDDQRNWIPWVPTLAFVEKIPLNEHQGKITGLLAECAPVVLTNPEAPELITPAYLPCVSIHVLPLFGDPDFQTSFLVESGGQLFPIFGYDWKYPDGRNTLELAPGKVWISAGYRTTKVLLKDLEVGPEGPTWVGVDTRSGVLKVARSPEPPAWYLEAEAQGDQPTLAP